MSVPFPALPRGSTVSPRLVRVGGDLISTLGGPTQRISRIGSRYSVEVELPTLDADCAGRWLACPLTAEATGQTLVLVMPQIVEVPPFTPPARGVGPAGASQIQYAGPAPLLAGTWFSFAAGGRNYLHLVTGWITPDKLTIAPALRVVMQDAVMELITPKLEGFVDETSWSLDYFRFIGHRFTLTESA